jgi:hypothetical protein
MHRFTLLLLGCAVAFATAAFADVSFSGCRVQSGEAVGAIVAEGTVALAPTAAPEVFAGSTATLHYQLLSNRRLQFVESDLELLTTRPQPLPQYDYVVEADGRDVVGSDACDIHFLATKLSVADAVGFAAGHVAFAVRAHGESTDLLRAVVAPTLTKKGCTKVCAPALVAACKVRCAGSGKACKRTCKKRGLAACRGGGTCDAGA